MVNNPDEPAILAEIEADLAEYPEDEVEILLNGAHLHSPRTPSTTGPTQRMRPLVGGSPRSHPVTAR